MRDNFCDLPRLELLSVRSGRFLLLFPFILFLFEPDFCVSSSSIYLEKVFINLLFPAVPVSASSSSAMQDLHK